MGAVRVDQLHIFYDKYLWADNIDLVVFSKSQDDSIVYDSQLDEHQNLHRLTNNVIFLWLNDGHYDLILSAYTFSRCSASAYCFECMRYFRRTETRLSHVCRTVYSCQQCYSSPEGCDRQDNFEIVCNECHVLFFNRECFERHLTKHVFRNSWGSYVSPCMHFFPPTCYKTVPRMTPFNKKKPTKHKCNRAYCQHCNKIKEIDHECFMEVCKIPKDPKLPTLYFFDFEMRVDECTCHSLCRQVVQP